ncbi:MAG: fructose-bisphosphate aldolase [Sphaerochaetaceae bacterium]|nr:fructose-bisphosphate aldolase [Sphaerochaetaceae bacterium]
MIKKLLLDSANLEEIKQALDYYPLLGITTNPTLLAKEINDGDAISHLHQIKHLLNDNQQLHIQTTKQEAKEIEDEALRIYNVFGYNCYVKIPCTKEGIKAMVLLRNKVKITATLIYTPMQGILATNAGAKYLAFYYNRMENNLIDPEKSFKILTNYIKKNEFSTSILAASFKNINQLSSALNFGADLITIPYNLLEQICKNPIIIDGELNFIKDWKSSNLDKKWF